MNISKPFDDCKIIYLAPNSKAPDGKRFPKGHLNAIPCPDVITENYGIVLDGQYIVVDIDSPKDCDLTFFPTWEQATKKGRHLLYKAPPGFKGQNRKLINAQGVIYGDLKCKGYIVGPGSVINDFKYHVVNNDELSSVSIDLIRKMEHSETIETGAEKSGIQNGSHDEFLIQLAGWLRGRHGLSEEAIARVLLKGPLQALQDVDPERPYTLADVQRIAHSIAKKAATQGEDASLLASGWQTLEQTDTHKDVTKWLLYRFIPKNELVLLYGAGGIGKSSLNSWVAGLAASKKLKVGFSGVEEPFVRFGVRAWLGNPGMDTASLYDIGNQWQFPRDAKKFEDALLTTPLDVVYFDSIYNHFESTEGMNAAERARNCLSPLARIAQELGVTIIGTFHENKVGNFLGSVEMENVTRILLHATRPKDKPLKIEVKKTNFIDPGYALKFEGELMPGCSLTGDPWLEEDENGQIVPEMFYVINKYYKSTGEDEEDSVDKSEQIDPRWEKIQTYIQNEVPVTLIAKHMNIPRTTLQSLISREGKSTRISHIDLDTI